MKNKLKNFFLIIGLYIFKIHLIVIYFFIKLFTRKTNDVFLLSRQFNEPSLNYKYIMKYLDKDNISYKVICKKVTSGLNSMIRNETKKSSIFKELNGIIKYYFNLYKQMYYCAISKVIITDGYNITVSLLKHKNSKIIQIWHSLGAIKKFGYQTIGYKDGLNPRIAKILKMHNNYDFVISASKLMSNYFAEAFGTKIENMVPIGTPSVDYLLTKNEDIVNKLYDKYPKLNNKINVLYSPTFRSDGTDNIDEVINAFEGKNINLILTFHPKNKKVVNNDNIISIDRKEFSTYDVMRIVDYVVTDYSALSIDAAILGKKVILYLYDFEKYNEENGINLDLFKELEGNVYKDINDIVFLIENNKYNKKSFDGFRKRYADFNVANNTKKLVDLIKDNL